MSEHVTWTTCPACGEAAAVGWLRDEPVEFDCRTGCFLPDLRLLREPTGPDVANPTPGVPLTP